jgi:phosphoserine phosphatase
LANYDAIVLDIGQADIHDTLSLGILFEIKSGSTSGPVLKDLLFKAYEFKVKFIPITIADYEIWVKDSAQAALYHKYSGETLTAVQLCCD